MKLFSFLTFSIFAMIPLIFFTSCQMGFQSGKGSSNSLSSSGSMAAKLYIQEFCTKNQALEKVRHSKTSRFRSHNKVDLSFIDESHVQTIDGREFFNLNVTINNTCLSQLNSGFSFEEFYHRRSKSMEVQSYTYFHPTSEDLDQFASAILQDPCVLRISPNHSLVYQQVNNEITFEFQQPNDPYLNQQQHLQSIDAIEGFSHIYNPTLGVNLLEEGEDVVIAVIDTGIDTNHPDLHENLWSFTVTNKDQTESGPFYGVDAVSLDQDIQQYVDYNPYDDDGHGTHVSGLIGAVANNSTGVLGVIPYRAKIMGVKVFRWDATEERNIPYKTAVLNGARWARDHGAKVINISLGTTPIYSMAYDPDWEILFEELIADGVSVVLATGNSGGSVPSSEIDNENFSILPAVYGKKYNGIINVGASQASSKLLASFSHYGSEYVEIAAPGTQINPGNLPDGLFSTAPQSSYTFGTTSGYAPASGTSQASPLVAGAIGQIYSFVKNKTGSYPSPCEAEAIVQYSAEKVESLDGYIKDGNHLNLKNLGRVLQSLY
jgi:hypothetical protein